MVLIILLGFDIFHAERRFPIRNAYLPMRYAAL